MRLKGLEAEVGRKKLCTVVDGLVMADDNMDSRPSVTFNR